MSFEKLLAFVVSGVAAVAAICFAILDYRKCTRENYIRKYGYRSSSIWILPAIALGMIAIAFFRLALRLER
jgi:energy-converting hydrogenase Eha subunit A